MNNQEKIEIINKHIESILPHILALENDIFTNPYADIEGKPSRSQVLLDFTRKKEVLEAQRQALTNLG